jgi:hypothetical protein
MGVFAFLGSGSPVSGVRGFAWPLIQTNIKAYHIGNNGFCGAFNDVVSLVVNTNNYRLIISGVLLYFYHIAGKNSKFEKFCAKMAVSHVYNKCPLSGSQVCQWLQGV